MPNGKKIARRFVPVLALLLLAAGCASSRLEKKAFEGRRIAATAAYPPEARVRHPLMAAAGRYALSGIARAEQQKLQRLQNTLKAAAGRVDLPARIASDLLETGARELGVIPSQDPRTADFVLDFRVYDYGLAARGAGSSASFYIEAEATIRDQAKKEVIWTQRLSRISAFKVYLHDDGPTQADLGAVLEDFAADASARMTKALRKDIKKD